MVRNRIAFIGLLAVIFVGWLAAGCSKPSYIDVRYSLPPSGSALSGMKAAIEIKDERDSDEILAGEAKEDFQYFTGIFSLSMARGEISHVTGTYRLIGLLREAFRTRLSAMGVEVVAEPSQEVPLVEIALERFLLEGADRKWFVEFAYEARLVVDGRIAATQTVAGKAERVKIVGHGGAEKVLGEIFSDSVNKLDLPGLLAKAGME